MMKATVILSLAKDVIALFGTILTVLPFFRLESAKRKAAALARPPTTNELVGAWFSKAHGNAKSIVDAPSQTDFRLTIVGLSLVALSYLMSLGLTYFST